MDVVHTDIDGHVATVTLHRPDARNALNPELIIALADTWKSLADDDQVRVIVVAAAEGSTFCAGFDLGTTIPIMTGAREPGDEFEQRLADNLGLMGEATLRDFDPGKPVIAAVAGHAIAGGMELMLAADLRVCAPGVKLGLSEVALGLIPAMGGTARLAKHLPRAVAMELLLGGAPVLSETLEPHGLFNQMVPSGDVLTVAHELADRIAKNAPLAVQSARLVSRAAEDVSETEALRLEAEHFAMLAETADAREGPLAFMERREPRFEGR